MCLVHTKHTTCTGTADRTSSANSAKRRDDYDACVWCMSLMHDSVSAAAVCWFLVQPAAEAYDQAFHMYWGT